MPDLDLAATTLAYRLRWGLVAFVACVALFGAIRLSSGDPKLERARSEMLASCEAAVGPHRDICGCLVDQVAKDRAMSPEAMSAFEREIAAVQDGARLACS